MRGFAAFATVFGPVLVAAGLAYLMGPDSAPLLVLLGFTLSATAGIATWGRARQRGAALERLALLRTKGIEIRNDGFGVLDDAQDKVWQARYEEWRRDALKAVERVAKHEALGFVTIGHYEDDDMNVVVMSGLQFYGGDLQRQLAFMTSDCRRLDEIRRRNS